jgi:DNA-damage-inducible protein D
MSDKEKPAARFGVDMPIEEAIQRFVEATARPEGEIAELNFEGTSVRRVLHNGELWFSVVDVVAALTDSNRGRKHWSDLKRQLIGKEGFSDLSAKIGKLPLRGEDGKDYPGDVATTETILRIIQSVPSPKAEPLKRWLAQVGFERIQETADPELAIKRVIYAYRRKGRSDEWIVNRIRSIAVRTELTAEWRARGIEEGKQYAILTNIISTATFGGVTTDGHMRLKGLAKHHNLRDHMTDLELIFTTLGEKSTREIARTRDAVGFSPNADAAKVGGKIAGVARNQLERETGERVVSPHNFLGQGRRPPDPEHLPTSGLFD